MDSYILIGDELAGAEAAETHLADEAKRDEPITSATLSFPSVKLMSFNQRISTLLRTSRGSSRSAGALG